MTVADAQGGAPTRAPTPRRFGAAGSHEDLTSKTLRGLQWTSLSTGAFFVMQIGYQAVINRLLLPETFGIMAIATLAMRFTRLMSTMGVSQALVQKPEVDRRDIRVAFTGTVMLASGVYAVVWFVSPAIAAFFREPQLLWVLRATTAALLIKGCGVTAEGLMQRRFLFQAIAIREIISYAVGFLVVGIGLALAGAGVWSLVAAVLTGTVLSTATSYISAPHSVVPLLDWPRFRALSSYGGRLSIISLVQFASNNIDTAAVGRFTSTALLGQYSRAYYLTSMPTNHLTDGLAKVLFPGLSRIQQDKYRLRRVYLGAVRLMAFALLPTCIGMAVAGRELVLVLLGPNWDEAIAIFPILALAAAFKVLSHVAGILCDARAELNRKLGLQVVHIGVLVGLLFAARGQGLWAYAAAFAAAEVLRYLMYLVLIERIIRCGMWRLLGAYAPAAVSGLVVAAAILGVREAAVAADIPVWLVLVAEVVAGATALAISLRLPVSRKVRSELQRRLGHVRRSSSPAGTAVRVLLG